MIHPLEPIQYRGVVTVRFADLDAYGIVNNSHYMDYVMTSRFRFLHSQFGLTATDLAQKGLGFVVRDFSITFLKPIDGLLDILIESNVEKMEGPNLEIPFRILEESSGKLYSQGRFSCVAIDMNTRRPCPIPEWVQPYFFSI
jgi:acyl-CoA thioester hydrolase